MNTLFAGDTDLFAGVRSVQHRICNSIGGLDNIQALTTIVLPDTVNWPAVGRVVSGSVGGGSVVASKTSTRRWLRDARWEWFFDACEGDRVAEARELLDDYPCLRYDTYGGYTAIQYAVMYNAPTILRHLYTSTARRDSELNNGQRTMHVAVFCDETPALACLDTVLEFEPLSVLQSDHAGLTPLHVAALYRSVDVMERLYAALVCGESVVSTDSVDSVTSVASITSATSKTDANTINHVNKGAKLHAVVLRAVALRTSTLRHLRQGVNMSPLQLAVVQDDAELVTYLQTHGLDFWNANFDSPLATACQRPQSTASTSRIVRLLGAARSPYALASRVCTKHLDFAAFHALLSHKVVRATQPLGAVLHQAVRNGFSVEEIDMLVRDFECNVHARDVTNETVLHEAARRGNIDVYDYLVQRRGCDPLTINGVGNTVAHVAADNKHVKLHQHVLRSAVPRWLRNYGRVTAKGR
jgi:ankyrin repeat protein